MASTVTTYLFVYGTLRRRALEPAHELLARRATLIGTGFFRGKLYDLGRYPGALASRDQSDRVLGEIYRLRRATAILQRLDDYEGELFKRRRMPIRFGAGKKSFAWVYLYRGQVKEAEWIRSGDYLEFLARR